MQIVSKTGFDISKKKKKKKKKKNKYRVYPKFSD